jgi:c(7)-type cytochrome triheme protein
VTRGARTVLAALLAAPALAASAWNVTPPPDYGRVVLSNFTPKAKMAPVQFDHWRHRARHTCRVCHVDVGFAMTQGETRISASTNQGGFHCAACHDGKRTHDGRPVFAACGEKVTPEDEARCARCHSRGDAAQRRKDYEAFAAELPRRGGDVDWEAAEAAKRIRPADQVPGVSIPRPPMRMDKDVAITSKGWMTDVTFSHRKHAAWNGCEVCHPDIYPHKQADARKTMLEISAGESCGACHGKVAFSLADCQRCHLKQVR